MPSRDSAAYRFRAREGSHFLLFTLPRFRLRNIFSIHHLIWIYWLYFTVHMVHPIEHLFRPHILGLSFQL